MCSHQGGASPLQQASANAVSGILGALSDEDAAALVARSCLQRPGFRTALLGLLSPVEETQDPRKDCCVAPRVVKRVRRSAEARTAQMPRPGASGGDYMELGVRLLSGRHVATISSYGNDLVAVLKAEIADIEGTPVWQQQLLIGDCALEDQETLQSYVFHESDKGQSVVTLAKRDTFIPAAACQESRPGYEFKLGEHGLGYYAGETQEVAVAG